MNAFKEVKIVEIFTSDPSQIHRSGKGGELYYTPNMVSSMRDLELHLYFTSDENPEGCEWIYSPKWNRIFPNLLNKFEGGDKKIIASTDSLGLPKPTDEFVKKYCELGGIDRVMVEFEEHGYMVHINNDGTESPWLILNVTGENKICINLKDSWSWDEIYNILKKFNSDVGSYNRLCEKSELPENLILNWMKGNINQ